MTEYPFFIPPEEFVNKDRHEWSKKEAKAYFEWRMSIHDTRISILGNFLSMDIEKNIHDYEIVTSKVAPLIKSLPFAENGVLTNRGYAISADVGILMGECLLASYPDKLKWISLNTRKRAVEYNLPVITGFAYGVYFDPIWTAIVQSQLIISVPPKEPDYMKVYKNYCNEVPTA